MARRARSAARRTVTRVVSAPIKPTTIRVVAPSAPATRGRRFARMRGYARRAGTAVAGEKHMLTAFAAAGAYGLAERAGLPIPSIGPLGPAATVAVAAWLYGKTQKSQTALHLATGLGCIAINRLAATGTVVGESYEE